MQAGIYYLINTFFENSVWAVLVVILEDGFCENVATDLFEIISLRPSRLVLPMGDSLGLGGVPFTVYQRGVNALQRQITRILFFLQPAETILGLS